MGPSALSEVAGEHAELTPGAAQLLQTLHANGTPCAWLDDLPADASLRLAEARQQLDALIADAERGRKLRDGVHAAELFDAFAQREALFGFGAVHLLYFFLEVLNLLVERAQQVAQMLGVQSGEILGLALEDAVREVLELGVHTLVQGFGLFFLFGEALFPLPLLLGDALVEGTLLLGKAFVETACLPNLTGHLDLTRATVDGGERTAGATHHTLQRRSVAGRATHLGQQGWPQQKQQRGRDGYGHHDLHQQQPRKQQRRAGTGQRPGGQHEQREVEGESFTHGQQHRGNEPHRPPVRTQPLQHASIMPCRGRSTVRPLAVRRAGSTST